MKKTTRSGELSKFRVGKESVASCRGERGLKRGKGEILVRGGL